MPEEVSVAHLHKAIHDVNNYLAVLKGTNGIVLSPGSREQVLLSLVRCLKRVKRTAEKGTTKQLRLSLTILASQTIIGIAALDSEFFT